MVLGLFVRTGVIGAAGVVVVFDDGAAVVIVAVDVVAVRDNENLMFGCDMVRSRCCGFGFGAGVENCGIVVFDVAGVTRMTPGVGASDIVLVGNAEDVSSVVVAAKCCWSWETTVETICGMRADIVSRIIRRQISATSTADIDEDADVAELEEGNQAFDRCSCCCCDLDCCGCCCCCCCFCCWCCFCR